MTTRKPKTAEMKKMSELLPGGYSLSFSVDSETADQRIDRTPILFRNSPVRASSIWLKTAA